MLACPDVCLVSGFCTKRSPVLADNWSILLPGLARLATEKLCINKTSEQGPSRDVSQYMQRRMDLDVFGQSITENLELMFEEFPTSEDIDILSEDRVEVLLLSSPWSRC